MDFKFTEDQNAIRDLASQIFGDRASDEFMLEFDRGEDAYDDQLWSTLAEQGLLGITVPEAAGGIGLGLIELCLLLEEQGRRVATVPLYSTLVLGGLPKVVRGLRQKKALEREYAAAGKPPHPAPQMMQQTPINRVLSYGRTFVCDSMPLADFKAVSRGLGVTINDVFLCCAAGALRQMFLDGHYDPDHSPLIAATPFAGKRPEGMEGLGNFVTMDYCWLHTDIADPLERLHAGHRAATEMKEHLRKSVEMNADFSAILKIMPPFAVRLLSWWLREKKRGSLSLFANVALSNVPGPREPLYWDRYRLANWFSTGQICDGTCINMTMWSYCDFVNLCILADKQVLPDGWKLFAYFRRELDTLVSLIPQQTTQEKLAS